MPNPLPQGPGPGLPRTDGCALKPLQALPVVPPGNEGPTPVPWPLRGLRPLVPALHALGPAQAVEPGDEVRAVGPAGRGGYALARFIAMPCNCLGVCACLISVSSCLPACVLVSACLLTSLYFSPPLANLPHLLCSWVITPGQDCYLIFSLLAASSLHPLPFFLPADTRLPWQP